MSGQTKTAFRQRAGAGAGSAPPEAVTTRPARKPGRVRPNVAAAAPGMAGSDTRKLKAPLWNNEGKLDSTPSGYTLTASPNDKRDNLIRDRIYDAEGMLTHMPNGTELGSPTAFIPNRTQIDFMGKGVPKEGLARHHIMDKKSLIYLQEILLTLYATERYRLAAKDDEGRVMHPDCLAEDGSDTSRLEMLKTALIQSLQLSGCLLEPIIRTAIGLAPLKGSVTYRTLSAHEKGEWLEACFNDDDAAELVDYLSSESAEPDSPEHTRRKNVAIALQRTRAWAPFDIFIGPDEVTYRSDPASNSVDEIAASAQKAGLPISIIARYQACERLSDLVQRVHFFLANTLPIVARNKRKRDSEKVKFDNTVDEICSLMETVKNLSKDDYTILSEWSVRKNKCLVRTELSSNSFLHAHALFKADGDKHCKLASEAKSTDAAAHTSR